MTETEGKSSTPVPGAAGGVGGASPASNSSPARVVIVSDDWSRGEFSIVNSVNVFRNPEETYELYLKDIRESLQSSLTVCDFEVDFKVDKWVVEVMAELGFKEEQIARVHLFCVKQNPWDEDEDAMNVLVVLLYS
jgi:hypothetical protein